MVSMASTVPPHKVFRAGTETSTENEFLQELMREAENERLRKMREAENELLREMREVELPVLVDRALDELTGHELAGKLSHYKLDRGFLSKKALSAADEIISTANSEFAEYRDSQLLWRQTTGGARPPSTAQRFLQLLVGLGFWAGYALLVSNFWGPTARRSFFGALVLWIVVGLMMVILGLVFVGTAFEPGHDSEGQRPQLTALYGRVKWSDAVYNNGVLPFLRREINGLLEPEFGLRLSIGSASGLERTDDPQYLVETRSLKRFKEVLERYESGAIGLAGPRGAGKSALMRGQLLARYAAPEKVPQLSFVVSAPVRYDPREFVLHLYATLCREVIDLCDRRTRKSGRRTYQQDTFRELTQDLQERAQDLQERAPRHWPLSVALLITITAFVTAVAFLTIYRYRAPQAHAGQYDSAYLVTAGVLVAIVSAIFLLVRLSRRRTHVKHQLSRTHVKHQLNILRSKARGKWEQIRLLQTHTVGWSGKLALSAIGAEASRTEQLQRSERPLTLPELVDDFQRFLEEVADVLDKNSPSSGAVVMVCIDELDKIESAEAAQQFVNEIKGIFGVRRCHFLVSVSEDALSSFERRGLPIRDAFDSAFDAIIQVDYLDSDDSSRLLRGRVIGMSEPFLYLCHCLAGGLPRDLLRSAREMVELATDQPGIRLGDLCQQLVIADIARKAKALRTVLAQFLLNQGPAI